MGMFDAPATFSESFREGEPVTVSEAKLGPEILTEFGRDKPALFKIEGKWYSAFGQGLTNQVEAMEDGDLPAEVAMVRVPTKGGREVKRLVPVGPDGKPIMPGDDIPF